VESVGGVDESVGGVPASSPGAAPLSLLTHPTAALATTAATVNAKATFSRVTCIVASPRPREDAGTFA
jgi:hypothetical protein